MPFTPLHLGPALALGLAFKDHLNTPALLISSIAVDIEPLLVLLLGLRYPLHGSLHTLVGSFLSGAILGLILYLLNQRLLNKLWLKLMLVKNDSLCIREHITAGVMGSALHVLLDSPLYSDIKPFFPLSVNPLYHPEFTEDIYRLCKVLFMLGVVLYSYTIAKQVVSKSAYRA